MILPHDIGTQPSVLELHFHFRDVDNSAYYYKAVLWAVEKGVTVGTSDTTFSPNENVTRGQTVAFLYREAGSPFETAQRTAL